MQNQHIAYHGGQALRRGWTTGTCAAAAAEAAALLLLTGRAPAELRLETPGGLTFTLPVEQPHLDGDAAVCTSQTAWASPRPCAAHRKASRSTAARAWAA